MTDHHVTRKGFSWTTILARAAIIVAVLAGPARAAATTASFDDANRAYAEGHYGTAITDFESLVRARGWSAPLLYDLGNAYAQAGRIGPAVLSYERARVLAPRNADVAANLAYVRAHAGLPSHPAAWYQIASGYLSVTGWTWLAVIALWLAAASLLAARRWHWRRLVHVGVVALLLGVAGVSAIAVSEQGLNRAVVVANKSAAVRVSPFDGALSESSLSEGEVVAVLGRHGDFVHVRDSRGRAGWVQSSTVQAIVPRTS